MTREFTIRECTRCGELTFEQTHLHAGWDGWLQTEYRDRVQTVERNAVLLDETETVPLEKILVALDSELVESFVKGSPREHHRAEMALQRVLGMAQENKEK